jgi:hypothetical protein
MIDILSNRWDIHRSGLAGPYQIQGSVIRSWNDNRFSDGTLISSP